MEAHTTAGAAPARYGEGWVSEEARKGLHAGAIGVFGAYAKEYDASRPSYPLLMWDHIGAVGFRELGGRAPEDAADIGCGTGRGVMQLLEMGMRVAACEPDAGMLEVTRANVEKRGLTERTTFHKVMAEDTQLATHSLDLVTCLQAWHWVNKDRGLPEMHRVIRPGGIFAAIWNDRDHTHTWVDDLEGLVEKYNPTYRRTFSRHTSCEGDVQLEGKLKLLEHTVFPNALSLQNAAALSSLFLTYSYVQNYLGAEQKDEFVKDVHALVLERFGSLDQPLELPLVTHLYLVKAL
jgi:SAM-dependent methyltransferase